MEMGEWNMGVCRGSGGLWWMSAERTEKEDGEGPESRETEEEAERKE